MRSALLLTFFSILPKVMEQLAKEVCGQPEATVGKGDTHTSIAKKIRDVRVV